MATKQSPVNRDDSAGSINHLSGDCFGSRYAALSRYALLLDNLRLLDPRNDMSTPLKRRGSEQAAGQDGQEFIVAGSGGADGGKQGLAFGGWQRGTEQEHG